MNRLRIWHDHAEQAPACEQRHQRIASAPLHGRCDARFQLISREIAGSIHKNRQLVGVARLAAGRGAAPSREQLVEHRERRVVRPLAAHQLVQQRPVER